MLVAHWDGIVVRIWALDHPHPHVHVWNSGDKARIYIRNQELFDGELNTAVYRKIRKWLRRCQDEIILRWHLAEAGEPGPLPLTKDCKEVAKT